MNSELDIFKVPPTQTSIESSSFLHYKHTAPLLESTSLEFTLPPSNDYYLDLAHTMLHVVVEIKPNDKNDENLKVKPVNNFLHSLLSQVDVFSNNKLVTPSSNCYAYRSYIETLLNYGSIAKSSHLISGLWFDDDFRNINAATNAAADQRNAGLVKRQSFILSATPLDMIDHLHCDIFNQDKMLINGVEMRLRLVRSKDEFCLMDASDDGKFKVHITDATLLVRRVKVSPGVLLAHANGLAKSTAKYPLTRVEMKTFTLQAGIMSGSIDNCFLGQLPERLFIGFVDNKAFIGDLSSNPFDFENFKINYLSLNIDGVQISSKPLQLRYLGGVNACI